MQTVLARLEVDPARGLPAAVAAQRLRECGPNTIAAPAPPRWHYLLGEFGEALTEPLVLLLLAVGVIYALAGELRDAGAIFVVILVMAASELATEMRAKNAIAALQQLSAPEARVMREAAMVSLPVAQVVPGDVVVLRAGTTVPADGRLLETAGLRVDESRLTGESAPVWKVSQSTPADATPPGATPPGATALAEQRTMVFAGTHVTGGQGTAVIVATGAGTEVGRIAGLVRRERPPRTPLQLRMRELSAGLLWLAVGFSVLVPALGLLAGLPAREMLLTGMSLAFATIPEELPIIITLVLALGGFRLARRRAVVRRLRAAETLGTVTVIGTDKTGTLTANRMVVTRVSAGPASPVRLQAADEPPRQDLPAVGEAPGMGSAAGAGAGAVAAVLRAAVLASEAGLAVPGTSTVASERGDPERGDPERGDPERGDPGDPMELALVRAAQDVGLDVYALQRARTAALVALHPFDEHTRSMTAVYRWPVAVTHRARGVVDGASEVQIEVVTKGAVEAVLARCERLWSGQAGAAAAAAGEVAGSPAVCLDAATMPLAGDARASLLAMAEALACAGERVLAVAAGRADAADAHHRELVDRGLTFLGVVGLADPPRPSARQALAACAAAGVRVVMLTGDHPATAMAIARAVGIDAQHTITGPELDDLDESALGQVAATASVVARATPEHKLQLVRAWQAAGHVVAITGDGVNDAPALRAADIGVAMGAGGTDVAREAADLVIGDDNFATVAAAIGEGRVLYDNLRKGVRFYLAAKVALVLSALLAVLLRLPVPFTPLQIIVLELFMDLGAAGAFTADAAEEDVMSRPPRDPHAPFFDRSLLGGIAAGGLALFVAVLGVYLWALAPWSLRQGYDTATARTAAVATWLIGHIVLAIHLRSEREPVLTRGLFGAGGLLGNRPMVVWSLAAIAFLAVALALPPLRVALRLVPLPANAWTWIILAPLVATLPLEVWKLVGRARHRISS